MKKRWKLIFFCLLYVTVPCICMNSASALEPSGTTVVISTYEQFSDYCNDENFNGTLQLSKDIETESSGFSIVNNKTGSRQLTIDLNGNNIIAPMGRETWTMTVEANTTIWDSTAKGSIVFQKENDQEIRPYADTASIETFGYYTDDGNLHKDVSLRLENLSIICVNESLDAIVQTGFPGNSLKLIHCSLDGIQVKNNCGNCFIDNCQIRLQKDNTNAIQSISTPTMSGTSAGKISWEEPWLNDNLQIKDSRIAITGENTKGIEFQGYSMKVENSVISATGDNSIGISYGEYLFGDRDAVKPTIINSYISGLYRAIQYNKKDGEPIPIISDQGVYSYPDKRIDIAGAYYDSNGDIQQTTSDTKALYPINGGMVTGFVDVEPNTWYGDGVMWASENGLMKGVAESQFSPDTAMSRAMLLLVLARLDGYDISAQADQTWYAPGITWALANKVSDGSNPNTEINREQLVTMLWRYSKMPDSNYDMSKFQDYANISNYAKDAMAWAVEKGIINGVSDTMIAPRDHASRAQVALILQRFVANNTTKN